MDIKIFLERFRTGILKSGYEEKMSKLGVSPCSSAYAIEIAISCIKKLSQQDFELEAFKEILKNKIIEKSYYDKMKSINVGKKKADYALELICDFAHSLISTLTVL